MYHIHNLHKIAAISIASFLFFIISISAHAAGSFTTTSFGGKVIISPLVGVTCSSQYSMVIKPAGGFPVPGPLFIQSTKKNVSVNSSILGRINMIPDMNTCFIPSVTGKIPVPAWKIDTKNFGVTKGK